MTFEDLEAWQQARQLVNGIYRLTRERTLAKDFGLTSQVQRAAVSIMSNLAEGFERVHLQEKLQFYNTARASAGEVRSLLYVISDNYQESAAEAASLRGQAVSVGRLVTGLLTSTAKRKLTLKAPLLPLLAPVFHLLSSISSHLR